MRRRHFSNVCAFAAAALVTLPGCYGTYMSAVGVPSNPETLTPKLPAATLSEKENPAPETRASVEDLLDQTRKIITSTRFRERLAAYGEPDLLRMSPTGDYEDGKTVLASFLGALPQRRPVPVTITTGTDADGDGASTVTCDAGTRAVIQLSPAVLKWWRRSSAMAKSCAINTIAHELTHTVVDFAKDEARQPYTDSGGALTWLLGDERVVSYTVGALAQCTYLEQAGGLVASFDQCLHDRGTHSFNASGCDDGEDPSGPEEPAKESASTDLCTM